LLLSELVWDGICLVFVVVNGLRPVQLTKKIVTANAAKIFLNISGTRLNVRPWKARPERNGKCIIVFLTRQF